MRILITGANGMLGQELAPLLATRHDVCACGHAECDITDQVAVSRLFADASPQLVINCAAMADVDGCERAPARAMAVNARGAGNVARAAEAVGARVFHISTDYVFDGTKRTPYTEQDPVNPLSVYAHSKLEGERMVLYSTSSPSPHLIIRTSWLYGRHRTNFVDKTVANAKASKPIVTVTEQISCPTWTYHLAEKIVELAEEPAAGILHLAGLGECSRYEMAQYIVNKLGLPAEITATTWEKINPPARRPVYTAMTSTRLAELGLAPLPDWRAALSEYLIQRFPGAKSDYPLRSS
ncbi:MAG: dTDP-4-dehydrorhamnose reductase [Acidobacteria bacterium]|nr:dTDP-4-dehydrorhamnose reductase [Acidobacteriota bacterium]